MEFYGLQIPKNPRAEMVSLEESHSVARSTQKQSALAFAAPVSTHRCYPRYHITVHSPLSLARMIGRAKQQRVAMSQPKGN